MHRLIALVAALLLSPAVLRAEVICTLLLDIPTGEILTEQGDCDRRMTPASTFKLPLAVMGHDSGLLTDAETPVMTIRPGDPDWGGPAWRAPVTPRDWLEHSVVWYSQRLTHSLGSERLARYARDLGLGNADVSGDAGFDNGLDRSWIASSLAISPREQSAFIRGLVLGRLPVSPEAHEKTRAIVPVTKLGPWRLHGKTGGAYPRNADRSFNRARGIGWYVGWAEAGTRSIAFVRLTQATARQDGSPGILARAALLDDWPALTAD